MKALLNLIIIVMFQKSTVYVQHQYTWMSLNTQISQFPF